MKTSPAFLEFLVPGILLALGIATIGIAIQGVTIVQLSSALRSFSSAEILIQGTVTFMALSGAYALGVASSNIGGRLLKHRNRKAQRQVILAYERALVARGFGDVVHALRYPKGNASGETVRQLAAYIRAYCRVACAGADKHLQFHTDQARMLRALVAPAVASAAASLVLFARYDAIRWQIAVVASATFLAMAHALAQASVYRQKLLVSTSLDHLLAAADVAKTPRADGDVVNEAEKYVVAADPDGEPLFPITYSRAHRAGTLHLAVHIEVIDTDEKYLVWRRSDGRLELPGGHVEWELHSAETLRQAAARELLEELGHSVGMRGSVATVETLLEQMCSEENVSDRGRNHEIVTVFRVTWNALKPWQRDLSGIMSSEGNHDARWLSLGQIREHAKANRSAVNSSIEMLLARSAGSPLACNYCRLS